MSRLRERSWIRLLTQGGRPDLDMVCFPHSGGSAFAFADWVAALPAQVALVGVQYPGRGDRFVEPPLADVVEMAARTAEELMRSGSANRVLFGHSLGALVAYETALLLRDAGEEPLALCVSAALPPGRMSDRSIHLAPDDEFWSSLCDLGGIEPAIADNAELRDLLLPTIRSDLRAHAMYRPQPTAPPLSCPVRCYLGLGDPLVDENHVGEWAGITTGPFSSTARPGGHFHLISGVDELVADVLSQVKISPPPSGAVHGSGDCTVHEESG